MKNNSAKSISSKASELLMDLYENGKRTFSVTDAQKVTGLPDSSLRALLSKLTHKGVLTSLGAGLYNIVPLELGREREFLGNPFIVAREIARRKFREEETKYYISHASAMDIHQMVTQPQLVVYTTVIKQIKKNPIILGTEFKFITCQARHYFGIKKHWAESSESVLVSDIEKTVIDGLKMPEYCGGFSEVAKGFWIKRNQINYGTLIDYACRMDIGAIYRRLGYLLEVYEMPYPEKLSILKQKITESYMPLDPTLPKEGHHIRRWRLLLNVSEEELKSVVRT